MPSFESGRSASRRSIGRGLVPYKTDVLRKLPRILGIAMLPWIWLCCGPQYLYLSVQFLSKLPGMTPGITLLKSTSNSSRRYISAQVTRFPKPDRQASCATSRPRFSLLREAPRYRQPAHPQFALDAPYRTYACVHFRPRLRSRLLHYKRAALRAARFSFAPKTLESTSNFRPCESPPTSRELNAPKNWTPIRVTAPRERLCVSRLPKLWFAITMRRIPIGPFEDSPVSLIRSCRG
jgi:hypothetical protein